MLIRTWTRSPRDPGGRRISGWVAALVAAGLVAACSAPISATPAGLAPTSMPPAQTLAPTGIAASATPTLTPTPQPSPSPTATAITTPLPTLAEGAALEIRTIRMIDPATGWAIGGQEGGDDHILITGDGGLTWSDVSPSEPVPADPSGTKAAIGAFLDADRAWVVYTSADPYEQVSLTTVWRSVDAGKTWQASLPLNVNGLDLFFPRLIGFSGAEDGWLMVDLGAGMMHEYIALFTTQDGGYEWSRVLDPFGTAPVQSCDKTGVTFFDADAGWMTRDCHGVTEGLTLEITLDGGSEWTSLPLPTPPSDPGAFDYPNVCGVHSPRLFSDSVGALGITCEQYDESSSGSDDPFTNKRSYLYWTEDGGASWTIRSYPGGGLDFLDRDEILGLGRTISVSQDAGEHWQVVKTVSWDGQFSFVDEMNGWAVARSGGAIAFVRTLNGGETWQELQPVIRSR